jgi:hypothetical protein
MKTPKTNREFERTARRRLEGWLRRRGYDAPGFEVEWGTNGAGNARALRVAVRRDGEVVDVNEVSDYPGAELCESWARGER